MKEIILTNGNISLVDDEDFERVNQFKWWEYKAKHTSYARMSSNKSEHKMGTMMHIFILGKTDLITDHQNHNGLHNFRSNIRLCTECQNQMNRLPKPNCSSRYKGVYKRTDCNRYAARIKAKGIPIHIGMFSNETEAAKAYDQYAKELFGEFAVLNFPD